MLNVKIFFYLTQKAAIEREESEACFNYPEREQARPKVNPQKAQKCSSKGERLLCTLLAMSFTIGLIRTSS